MHTLSPMPTPMTPLATAPSIGFVFDDTDTPPEMVWYGRSFPQSNKIELNLPRLMEAARQLKVDAAALVLAVGLHERLHLSHPHATERDIRRRTVEALSQMGQHGAVAALLRLMEKILSRSNTPAVGEMAADG